jgi:hypothetical protein
MSDVQRPRSAHKEVSKKLRLSIAVREQNTALQASYFTVRSVGWGVDRNHMIFRPTTWTAERDRL